jgi:hypothetical protein
MPIDKSLLSPGWTDATTEDGIFAEFHENGTIKHVGLYRNSLPVGDVIFVAEDGCSAHAECLSRFPESKRSPTVEDDPPDLAEATLEWVEDKLTGLYDRANFITRCSFCQKRRSEVLKIIAGPSAYICNECIRLCNDILSEGL